MSETITPIEHVLEGLNQAENDLRALFMIDVSTMSDGELVTLAVASRHLAEFLVGVSDSANQVATLRRNRNHLVG